MAGGKTAKTGVTEIKRTSLNFESAAMLALLDLEVLVGVPDETSTRNEGNDGALEITNAAIAYIQDNGAPEINLPARPFMREGIRNATPSILKQLDRAARAAIAGNLEGVDQSFHGAGLAAQRGIQNRIKEGIPPPLSEYTLKERARKGRKGAALELEARERGEAPGLELATPLIDTGELLQSIKYAIRRRDERT